MWSSVYQKCQTCTKYHILKPWRHNSGSKCSIGYMKENSEKSSQEPQGCRLSNCLVLESSSPKDALWQVWFLLTKWFLGSWKCEKFTEATRMTENFWSEKLNRAFHSDEQKVPSQLTSQGNTTNLVNCKGFPSLNNKTRDR